MQKPKSYCEVVEMLDATNVHRIYHDNAYGFRVANDDELFERLVLEINQAGLSWNTILLKQKNFKKAYHNFNIKKVASYGAPDRKRLLKDAGIIRNRLKVDAAIFNANVILQIFRNYKPKKIIELIWEQFLKYRKWHSTMRAWNLSVTQNLLKDSKIIFESK